MAQCCATCYPAARIESNSEDEQVHALCLLRGVCLELKGCATSARLPSGATLAGPRPDTVFPSSKGFLQSTARFFSHWVSPDWHGTSVQQFAGWQCGSRLAQRWQALRCGRDVPLLYITLYITMCLAEFLMATDGWWTVVVGVCHRVCMHASSFQARLKTASSCARR